MNASPQHQQPDSQEAAAELVAKYSSAGVQKHIQQRPSSPWKSSAQSGDTPVSFVVKFSGEEGQRQQLQWLTRDHQLFAYDTMEGSLNVVMSRDNTRVECNGKSIHGDNFIYISDKQSGFLFLDKTSKTFIHIPHEGKTRYAFREPITGEATVTEDEKRGTTLAEIAIASPYSLRYVLELNTDSAWAPFRKNIVCMLIGCRDRMGEAGLSLDPIIDAGVPVKGEVFMEQSAGRWQKMSSFTLSDLMPYDGSDEPFSIPAGYRDLRKLNNKGEKGKSFGPAARLSEYRKASIRHPGPGRCPSPFP
jgi:hypothetical protein